VLRPARASVGLSPTPAALARCAGVNKAFRAAAHTALHAVLTRTFPAAVALDDSGAIELNRGIAHALASSAESIPPPLVPLSAYSVIVQVRYDDYPVFTGEARFTDDDADLPLRCERATTPSGLPRWTPIFVAFICLLTMSSATRTSCCTSRWRGVRTAPCATSYTTHLCFLKIRGWNT